MALTITYDDTVSAVKASQQMLNCTMRVRHREGGWQRKCHSGEFESCKLLTTVCGQVRNYWKTYKSKTVDITAVLATAASLLMCVQKENNI